jgi:hypothetical protein
MMVRKGKASVKAKMNKSNSEVRYQQANKVINQIPLHCDLFSLVVTFTILTSSMLLRFVSVVLDSKTGCYCVTQCHYDGCGVL